MLRSKIAATVVAIAATTGAVALTAPSSASAAPAIEVSAGSAAPVAAIPHTRTKASSVIARRALQVDCNGASFNYSGYSWGWGPNQKYRYILGSRNGSWRMAKVFAGNSSTATWSLGGISYSGAVVESSSFGYSYCITFPATNKGVVMRARQNGVTSSETLRW